jgi:hypothetical protein
MWSGWSEGMGWSVTNFSASGDWITKASWIAIAPMLSGLAKILRDLEEWEEIESAELMGTEEDENQSFILATAGDDNGFGFSPHLAAFCLYVSSSESASLRANNILTDGLVPAFQFLIWNPHAVQIGFGEGVLDVLLPWSWLVWIHDAWIWNWYWMGSSYICGHWHKKSKLGEMGNHDRCRQALPVTSIVCREQKKQRPVNAVTIHCSNHQIFGMLMTIDSRQTLLAVPG